MKLANRPADTYRMSLLALLAYVWIAPAHAQYAVRPWPPGDGSDPLGAQRSSQLQQTGTQLATGPNGQPLVFEALKKKEDANGSAASRNQMPQMPQMPNMGGMGGGGAGGAGSRRPTSDDISGSGRDGSVSDAAIKDCGSSRPDPTALQTALECVNKKLSVVSTDKMALADTDGKIMFIIDRQTKQAVGCVQISTGKNGKGDGYGQTPLGLVITGPHNGARYQSSASGTERDAIGLTGTDANTKVRTDNGVVMHKAHGSAGRNSTLGCIGVEDSQFDAVKRELYGSDSNPKRSPVFIYDRNSREKCSSDGKGGGGSGGDSQEATY